MIALPADPAGRGDAILDELLGALSEMRGAAAAPLRALRRAYTRRLRDAPAARVVRIAGRLVAAGSIEQRWVAYELVHYHRAALAGLKARDLARLGRGLDGWGAVDAFACVWNLWRVMELQTTLFS